jgi:hypothetical protein
VCVFRFNRRNQPMAAFQALHGISTQNAPQTLPELIIPESTVEALRILAGTCHLGA